MKCGGEMVNEDEVRGRKMGAGSVIGYLVGRELVL